MAFPRTERALRTALDVLIAQRTRITTSSLAEEAGVARQTAFTFLKREVAAGALRQAGSGPGTHYEPTSLQPLVTAAPPEQWRFPLAGLEEDKVLKLIRAESIVAPRMNAQAGRIFDFVVTEMVNNAIDHSRGSRVDVRLTADESHLFGEIEDDGQGLFRNVRTVRGLSSDFEAAQDLSKGKVTTDPARHTGQGIFFSSRAVDRFIAESGALRWIVDMLREDSALEPIPVRVGTLIRFELAFDTRRELKDVFDAYSGEDYAFTKTRTWIRLFETGLAFVSRSEAKRLLVGLEKFEEAVLDFSGVSAVGQGFADEVFRVWASANPATKLVPIKMNPAVEFMVTRARLHHS